MVSDKKVDLSNIKLLKNGNYDWDNVLYNSISNEIKRICLLKKTNDNLTVKEISDMTKHNNETIRRWLHIGDKIGICNYKGYSK